MTHFSNPNRRNPALALAAIVLATLGLHGLKPAAPRVALGLAPSLAGETPRTFEAAFPGGAGRWEVRGTTFRHDGLPQQLLVLSDLSRVLRAEERSAWQRLVRVLGHEINNSLAPIKSIAGSLRSLAERAARPRDWEQDLRSGLQVIEDRSESLARFMGAYAQLARLPRPTAPASAWC